MDGIDKLRRLAGDLSPASSLYACLKCGTEERWGAEPCGKSLADELREIADGIDREAGAMDGGDREAAEWVRDTGGLDEVKNIWSAGVYAAEALGIPTEGIASGEALCYFMGEAYRRTMPEGCEWPAFEDGEPVRIGDTVRLYDGSEEELRQAHIARTGFSIYTDTHDEWYRYGERVKRPQVLAADGEPLEAGQAVWDVSGTSNPFTVVSIRTGTGDPMEPTVVTCKFGDDTRDFPPDQIVHFSVVLDADGAPIHVGDTVWHEDGTKLEVLGFGDEEDGETLLDVRPLGDGERWSTVRSLSVTHAEPDNWDRLKSDIYKAVEDDRSGGELSRLVEDIVRRCKKIAGVE